GQVIDEALHPIRRVWCRSFHQSVSVRRANISKDIMTDVSRHGPSEIAKTGQRVQVRAVLLRPEEPASGIPEDKAAVPYVVRVRGRLAREAAVGESAEIKTATGREVRGILEVIQPGDNHTFGVPPPALVRAQEYASSLRTIV